MRLLRIKYPLNYYNIVILLIWRKYCKLQQNSHSTVSETTTFENRHQNISVT